ncbi:MAG: 50S ribosomal protein L32 [Verrucomicrobia bacterium]|jgi:large subunit ribosomal protein L32|nr:50S ribosomal protein L32 [Verrucomicrobiota bacterium]NDE63618.1 50S ribosomal protein L32 [Chlamydiota bacterium]
MAVPRNRMSKSRTLKRRTEHAFKPVQLIECPNCKAHKKSHRMCLSCGHYNGKSVFKEAKIA